MQNDDRNLIEYIQKNIGNSADNMAIVKGFEDVGGSSTASLEIYLLDSEKLRCIFNWKDKINLDEGISRTLNWVKCNLLTLKKLPWKYLHKS